MSLPNIVLSRFSTNDGVDYDQLTTIYFDASLVDIVNANGSGNASKTNDAYGQIAIADLVNASFTDEGGTPVTRVEVVLNTDDTYSTPNGFINARIAELQAEILALQGLLQ